jgi:hypothetical protein
MVAPGQTVYLEWVRWLVAFAGRSQILLFPVVGKVVLHEPRLALVGRTAAELPNGIRPQFDELQMPF